MGQLFRVLYRDGKPFVAKRELIDKRGSWMTLKCSDGTIVKENGHSNWSETILEAIQREAECIMWRHGMPKTFEQAKQVDSMDALFAETMEWGSLIGWTCGSGAATRGRMWGGEFVRCPQCGCLDQGKDTLHEWHCAESGIDSDGVGQQRGVETTDRADSESPRLDGDGQPKISGGSNS